MCEVRALRAARQTFAAALILLAAGGSLPVQAQSAAAYRARLAASLHHRTLALDSLEQLRARRTLDLPPDSLSSGVIRVRYSRANLGADLQATLVGAVQRAATIADAQLGDATFDSSATSVLIVSRVRGVQLTALEFGVLRLELPGTSGRISVLGAPVTQRKLADAILDLVGTLATQQAPANVVRWAGFWAPSRPLTADDWRDAALDLTTSSSSVTRTCYAGSVSACESALGLTAVQDTLAEWYSPEAWRALVRGWQPPADSAEQIAARAQCVDRRVMATCKRLARLRRVPIPLNMQTRSTLFDLAIARGGRSAYTRLRGAKGTPLQVLAATAGVGPEVLVDDWRTHVLAAVPSSAVPTMAEGGVLMAWVLVFGVAATRRRPWR